MNVAQVKRQEAAARRKAVRDAEKEHRTARRKDLQYARWAMKTLYPEAKVKLEKDIKQRIKDVVSYPHMKREVTVERPSGEYGRRFEEALKRDFKGFAFSQTWHEGGYMEMGDSAAPCNVWYDPYWVIHISW